MTTLCQKPNWNVIITQGSTFQRVLDFGEIDMTGVLLRGAIARRPGSPILVAYTFTVLQEYALSTDNAAPMDEWTLGTGVTLDNGWIFAETADQVGAVANVPPCVSGTWYSVTVTVTDYLAGSLWLALGTVLTRIPVTGDGTYTVAGLANTTRLAILADGITSLTVASLTCSELTPCRANVSLTATQTAALPAGTCWHDVEAYTEDGWVRRILSGSVTVTPEVTR